MRGDVDLSTVAALLADRSRARMCRVLLDGRFHTAGELARCAGIAASTASEHLAALVAGGLLEATARGRHRYFRLANPDVAHALEALAVLADAEPVRSLRQASTAKGLRGGRLCYDHLAGRLGVDLTGALITAGVVTPDYALGDLAVLRPLEVTLPRTRREPVRPCLDWTERRYHLAGSVVAALTSRLFELDWLERVRPDRAVRLTATGRDGLAELLPAMAETG